MSKKVKTKKNYIQIITIILVIVSIICMALWGIIYAVNYAIIGEDEKLDENGNIITVSSSSKKKVINALICGKNEELTDTIIYLKYNVETGKIGMMSIPRDTSIVSNPTLSSVYKINYMYQSKGIMSLVNQVENMLDVNIDYYLVFDASMLKEMVDAIGGVEVDVPIRM